MTNKTHWEIVYNTKLPNEVSWTLINRIRRLQEAFYPKN